jgi:hypothetical protein
LKQAGVKPEDEILTPVSIAGSYIAAGLDNGSPIRDSEPNSGTGKLFVERGHSRYVEK